MYASVCVFVRLCVCVCVYMRLFVFICLFVCCFTCVSSGMPLHVKQIIMTLVTVSAVISFLLDVAERVSLHLSPLLKPAFTLPTHVGVLAQLGS